MKADVIDRRALDVSTSLAVTRRRFPYPYRAMLAICSDLDETPDREVYFTLAQYLNTTDDTILGPGVGLEVGNTLYFDMPSDQFAYWNTDDPGRAMVRALIQSGHVDCLHSFGDLATTREHARRALEELARHDCRIQVWVDHAVAPTNFGADIMRGAGDLPDSPVYHADLTCDHGVTYAWKGRVTSVIGQDRTRSLRGVFRPTHPITSLKTLGKEYVKGRLGEQRHPKYAMHGPNDLMRLTTLRDGRCVYEFMRCNPFWGGVEHADTAAGIARVLTRSMLERLVVREGTCVLYTHLGKIRRREEPFEAPTREAFSRLAEFFRDRRILVTTTRRLLGYRRARDEVIARTYRDPRGDLVINLERPSAPIDVAPLTRDDLQGLTFYVDHPEKTRLFIEGEEQDRIERNPPDHTGQAGVSIPWSRLEFPDV